MTNIQLNVLFKKMQKDDKKEVLLFHIQTEDPKHTSELLSLTGKMAILTITDSYGEYEPIQAEFVNFQRDNKKTVLKFNVMTEDEDRVNAIYPAAGTNVSLLIQPSQMSIDEVNEGQREGIEYDVEADGTVSLKYEQLMEEVDQEFEGAE